MPGLESIPNTFLIFYRRAPATFATVTSLLISYLINTAYLDWTLFRAIGQGGIGKPTFAKWLIHAFILRPLSMSTSAAKDPTYLPPDDLEWKERLSSAGQSDPIENLPHREGSRPELYGFIPHRQVEMTESKKSEHQKAIISHLVALAGQYPAVLKLSLSTYEHTTSPSLFVRHTSHLGDDINGPTHISRLYISGNPPPKRSMQGTALDDIDDSYHELAHIHVSEGSMHVSMSPQDARRVVERGWGELHRLAGSFYRGHYFPPYWLPTSLFNMFGGQSRLRWSYLERKSNTSRGKLIPPTYCLLYAANSKEQVEWVNAIIDSTVAWAVGQPMQNTS